MKLARILNGALNASLVAVLFSTAALAQTSHPTTVGHPFTLFSAVNAATAPKKAATAATAGASVTMGDPLSQIGAKIQAVTVNDLQAAIADATAKNDIRHLPCWQAILPIVQNNELIASLPVHLPTAVGFAELAQTYFDDKAGIANLQTGLQTTLDPVVTACALTMADLQMGVIQFAGLIGLKLAPLALPVGL